MPAVTALREFASLPEERLQLALDAAEMGTWSYDLRTGSQVWDSRQYALFGLSPDVVPTRELFLSMVLPEDRTAVQLTDADLEPGVRHDSQFRIRRPDGSIRWLVAHSLTRTDEGGEPAELVGVNWDITAQKQAEAVLQQNAQQLELALDAARMGTWRYDLLTGRQQWNERQYELLGLPPTTEASRSAFVSVVLPEDRPLIAFTDDDLLPGRVHDTEFRIRRPDGEVRWLAARSFARHDRGGKPIERIGVNLDITERKQAELDAREAERRLALATSAAGLGIWDWNIETGAFYYSPRAREIYGFGPTEILTYDRLRQRTHPDDYRQIEPILGRALDPDVRSQETYRYRITRADNGEERWVLAHGEAVFESRSGAVRPVRFTGTLQDITDDVRTEQALADERARLQLALEAGELAIWELDMRTNTVTSSPALNRLYGFPEDSQPAAEDFGRAYAPGERERIAAETAAPLAARQPSIAFEARHILDDGAVKWIGVRARVAYDGQGTPVRAFGVAMDTTERRLSEERLRLTARELQHRVKNTLSVVQAIASQSFRGAPSKEEGMATFAERLRALARATDLLSRGNWRAVSMADVVAEAIGPYRDEHQDQFHLSGGAVEVDSRHATALALALHELSTNAVKYGALSTPTGRVHIGWNEEGGVSLEWRETGGPMIERAPARSGFGTRLLERGLFDLGSGSVHLEFRPEGAYCRITIRPSAPSQA